MIYFTSDLHFYHDNVIQFAHRPFADREEMHQTLIQNWNETVSIQDEIYILGDFTMKGPTYAMDILSQLKGKKYLIKGNHDSFVEQQSFDSSLFVWVKDYYELKYNDLKFVLFHYPIQEWNGFFRDSYHLHGHQHNHLNYNYNNLAKGLRRYDVGVDANGMKPVSIEEILAFFQEMPKSYGRNNSSHFF